MNLNSLVAKIPNYPGRKGLEALVGPLVTPLAGRYAGQMIQRLLGFWVMQAVYGDVLTLVEAGVYSRSTCYKQSQEFREVFGMEPQDFLPEVAELLHGSPVALKIGFPDRVRPLKTSTKAAS